MLVMGMALATYVVNFAQFAWRGVQSAKQRRRTADASRGTP
jgi:hypothetical protein